MNPFDMNPFDDSSTPKTVAIINKGGRILLKKNGWYLSSWSNIAAGPDRGLWGRKRDALFFFNLHWAHTIAQLYQAKVVVSYPHKQQ